MIPSILNAVSKGYTASRVLNHLTKKSPKLKDAIQDALSYGYTANTILKHISGDKNNSSDQYLTEREKTRKGFDLNRKRALSQAVGTLGAVGAGAAGIYGLMQGQSAIRPSAILPAQQSRPMIPKGLPNQTINMPNARLTYQQGGLPQPQARGGLPYSPQGGGPKAPQAPTSPIPQGSAPQAPIPYNPERNINLVRNIKVDNVFENIAKNGYDIATASQILRKLIPRAKIDILDKVEGGLEKVFEDYSQHLQQNPVEQRRPPPLEPHEMQPQQQEIQQAPAESQQMMQQPMQEQVPAQIQEAQAPESQLEYEEILEKVSNDLLNRINSEDDLTPREATNFIVNEFDRLMPKDREKILQLQPGKPGTPGKRRFDAEEASREIFNRTIQKMNKNKDVYKPSAEDMERFEENLKKEIERTREIMKEGADKWREMDKKRHEDYLESKKPKKELKKPEIKSEKPKKKNDTEFRDRFMQKPTGNENRELNSRKIKKIKDDIERLVEDIKKLIILQKKHPENKPIKEQIKDLKSRLKQSKKIFDDLVSMG